MKKNQGFVGIIIAILAALIIGGGAVYLVTKPATPAYQNTQDNNYQSPVADQTENANPSTSASWKTYTNSKYGFEIKYPSNWHAFSTFGDNNVLLLKSEKLPNIGATEGYAFGDQISVGTHLIENNNLSNGAPFPVSKEDYIKQHYPDAGFNGPGSLVKTWVNINNMDLLRVDTSLVEVSGHALEYLYFKNDRFYSFYLYPYEPIEQNRTVVQKQNYQDLQNIISTFKFTNQTSAIGGNITSDQVDLFHIGEPVPGQALLSQAKYFIKETTILREGTSEKQFVVSGGGKDLLTFLTGYLNNISDITVISPEFKTTEGIGVGSTITDFIKAYPNYKFWYSQEEGEHFVLNTSSNKASPQFALDRSGLFNPNENFNYPTFRQAKISDFNSNATIANVRVYYTSN